MPAPVSIIQLCRPKEWVKNLFVLLPLFFSGNLFNFPLLAESFIALVSFCLASSAIYCLNDLMDVESDRRHPAKRLRPLASGKVSSQACIVTMAVLGISAVAVLLTLPPVRAAMTTIVVAAYLLLNSAYCLRLKRIALIDVVCVALGFVLRVVAGGAATGVYVSHWIIIMTFLLALFLSLCKRRDDIVIYNTTGEIMRHNITRYNLEFINQATTLVSTVMLVSYVMYTVSADVTARFNSGYVYVTSVFVLLGLLRYIQLTVVDERSGSPTRVFLNDRFIQGCVAGWFLTFAAIIYL